MLAYKCPECDGPRSCCSCPRPNEDDGHVPDRETFWLVERKVSPPQYVGTAAGWTTEPWKAERFNTERAAHDHWRTMTLFRDESAVVEHLFINRK